jgi:iron complex outermembrane receptor protein
MTILPRKFRAALTLIGATGLLAVAGRAQPSAAVDPAPTGPAREQPVVLEKYVTTGSYLPVTAVATANPVTTIESTAIGMSGQTDPLQMLRQLTPYFSGNNNIGTEWNNGGGGETNLALRNMQTLVLVNGQRAITSPFSNTNGANPGVDLNTLPVAAIDRIEILRDGASTVYGSDAIAGVVNVILKKNYNGLEVSGRYGSTGKRDYKTRRISAIASVGIPGGSLTVVAEHFENTPLRTTSRGLTMLTPGQINALGYNVSSAVYSGVFPGRVNSSVIAGSPLAVGAPGYNAAILTPPAKTDPNAAPQTLDDLTAAGIYLPLSATPAFAAVGSASILNTALYGNQLITATRRNNFALNGEKELLGKNLVAFGDFLYSQTKNVGSGLAPAPVNGIGPAGGNTLTVPANNPYNLFGIVIGVGGPAGAPTVRTRLDEIGRRTENFENHLWRIVGGLRGELTDRYSWEATYNYSRESLTDTILGGANGASMNTAMMPLLTNGAYTYNAAGRPLSMLTGAGGTNVPVFSPFAVPGFNDPATLAALRTTLFKTGATSFHDIGVRLRGTPFALPAGDMAFAIGVETRTEDLTFGVDGLYANGLALGYNRAATFAGGSRSTRGAFLETQIPIMSRRSNLVGLHSLSVTLADREERIKPGGNANTPKVGLRWEPFSDEFVFRATAAKGFIAPSLYNLFGPSSGNSPSFSLPQGDGSSGSGGTIAGKAAIIQGTASELSNPNLAASKSKSYTAGFIWAPRYIKGLSVSVDYYHIWQDKVGSIDYTTIVADLNAKGSASIYNQDLSKLGQGFLFADGSRLTSAAPNQVNSTNFGQISVAKNPEGDMWTDGVDLRADYTTVTSVGRFNGGVLANWLFNYRFRATPRDPYLQYARVMTDTTVGGAGAQGLLPGYVLKPYINWSYKGLGASLFMNYIPATTVPGTLFGGAKPTNDYTINGRASQTPDYFTADFSVSYTIPSFGHSWLRNLTVVAGANNVFNRPTPYVPGNGANVAENNTVKGTYDIIGRFYFVELKKAF